MKIYFCPFFIRMVRPGATTCLHTKNVEDLENTIIHTFSEEGEWVLDICCKSRELSLAAQKAARNAIAIDTDEEMLDAVADKAAAIAKAHDDTFKDSDGVIARI